VTRLASWLALLVVLAALVLGCSHKKGDPAGIVDDGASVVVKPDSDGLLLTWIDDKGDFHVEQKVADVPMQGRDAVRVIDPSRAEGTSSDKVFVADLRTTKPDGTYPVSVMTRAQFEAIAVARREKSGPTMASAAAPEAPSAAPTTAGAGTPVQPTDPNGGSRPVIIYGASWCGPCHQAEAFFKKRGVPYVEKDIEEDTTAQREMMAKLVKAGLRNAGRIPVIDVHGKILIGFDPGSIDDALGKAL
jgi:glutaredoxin